MSELRNKIDKLSDTQKGDALEYYLTDNRHNNAVRVLEKTIDDIIFYLENNNLVENLDDKDDKSFDRGKVLLKDLLTMTRELEEQKMSALNVEQKKDFIKKSAKNGMIQFIMQSRGEE